MYDNFLHYQIFLVFFLFFFLEELRHTLIGLFENKNKFLNCASKFLELIET